MNNSCQISEKISKIFSTDEKYSEKMFAILHPYVTEYRNLELEYGLFPEYFQHHPNKISPPKLVLSYEEAIMKISDHPIVLWLKKQKGLIEAKEKISKKKLVTVSEPGIEVIKECRNKNALEFICISIIYYFSNNPNLLEQTIATKDKHEAVYVAMRKLNHAFKKGGGIYFSIESEQHMLQLLLEKNIKTFDKNVFSSERSHPNLLRHLFTKKIINYLFTVFGYEKITSTMTVAIALDITSIFFARPMDKSDASIEAKKIRNNIIENEAFKQQNIGTILANRGLELMKF